MRTFLTIAAAISGAVLSAQGHTRVGYTDMWGDGEWDPPVFRQIWHFGEVYPDTITVSMSMGPGAWLNMYRTTQTWRPDGQLEGSRIDQWNTTLQTWEPSELNEKTYDASDLETEHLNSAWTGADWEPVERTLSTYNVEGHLTGTTTQRWNNGWHDRFRQQHTTDEVGNPIIMQFDSLVADVWTTYQMDYNTYDSEGRQTEMVMWSDIPGVFTEYLRFLFNYDENGDLETRLTFVRLDAEWIPVGQTMFTPAGDELYNEIYQYNTGFTDPPVWENYQRLRFDPHDVNSITVTQAHVNTTIFPNPTTGLLSLALEGLTGRAEAMVLDAQGRQVGATLRLDGSDRHAIDLSGHTNGLYMVRIITESGGMITKPIMLQQ